MKALAREIKGIARGGWFVTWVGIAVLLGVQFIPNLFGAPAPNEELIVAARCWAAAHAVEAAAALVILSGAITWIIRVMARLIGLCRWDG